MKYILKYLVVIPVLMMSCQEETLLSSGSAAKEEINVIFSISTRTGSETRALTAADEDKIATVDILVFRKGYFVERAIGEEIGGNSSLKDFKVKLTRSNNPDNYLVVIANAREAVNNATLRGTKDEVLSSIVFENKAADGRWPVSPEVENGFVPIPMHGEYGPVPIDENIKDVFANNPVPMYRAMARIDIGLDPSVDYFTLTSVYVYKYNTRGCVVPGPDAKWRDHPYNTDPQNPQLRVTNVTVPEGTTPVMDFIYYPVPVGHSSLSSAIYLMEIDRAEKNDYSNATCLIIGGRYGGDTAPVTYYRLDINILWYTEYEGGGGRLNVEAGPTESGRLFARILRNHLYDITIDKVKKPGAKTPESARKQNEAKLNVIMNIWHNFPMVFILEKGTASHNPSL